METTLEKARQRPGPVPGPPTKKYTVLLPPDLGEWAKQQPGGLSDLMRRLLVEAKGRDERRGKSA